jgi:hypothetical protein
MARAKNMDLRYNGNMVKLLPKGWGIAVESPRAKVG